ncbi:DUF3575 domain-containing protein [Zobellia nedashkovskayae]
MQKNYLVIILLFSIFSTKAQNQNSLNTSPPEKKNDVKINAFFMAYGFLEVAYERNLNKKSSLGISVAYALNQKYSLVQEYDEDTNFLISPFYRRYFGKKYASGFFFEGFTTLGSTDGKQLTDLNGNLTLNEGSDVIDLSLGAGLGYKWVTKSGIIIEPFFTYGWNLFNADKTDHTVIARRGINIGYRF